MNNKVLAALGALAVIAAGLFYWVYTKKPPQNQAQAPAQAAVETAPAPAPAELSTAPAMESSATAPTMESSAAAPSSEAQPSTLSQLAAPEPAPVTTPPPVKKHHKKAVRHAPAKKKAKPAPKVVVEKPVERPVVQEEPKKVEPPVAEVPAPKPEPAPVAAAPAPAPAPKPTPAEEVAAGLSVPQSFAAATFGSPIAYGADWGSVGIGIYGVRVADQATNTKTTDGSAGISFGLGDSQKYVGLETDVGVSSISHRYNSGFGRQGSFGFKLHRELPWDSSVAVGVIGVGQWGGLGQSNRASVYGGLTKIFGMSVGDNPLALVVNAGVGNEQFAHNGDGVGGYGSLAFYVVPQVSLIADYSGRFFNSAISMAPFSRLPLTLTLGAFNIAREQNLRTGFAGTLGYGFTF